MKHISQLLIIVFIALLVCVGCGSATQKEETTSEISETVTEETETTESKEASYAETIMRAFQEYTETHECDFIVNEESFAFEKSPYFSTGNYSFEIEYSKDNYVLDEESFSKEVYFSAYEDDSSYKSFRILFDSSTDSKMIKSFITAALKITNSSLDDDSCVSKMQEFVNSYTSDNISMYLDNGDYVLLIVPDTMYSTLYVTYKDELSFVPENIDDYKELDYSSALSELNKGNYVCFKATVNEIKFGLNDSFPAGFGYLICTTADGNTVFISYEPEYRIEPFVEGNTYEFYGSIIDPKSSPVKDNAFIALHGAKEVE